MRPRSSSEQPQTAEERWRAKRAHYQDEAVARDYDAVRFETRHARRSTERKWRAIQRALPIELGSGARVLDMPCGRGRFTARWLASGVQLVSADLSRAMLDELVRSVADPKQRNVLVQCEAERLPFADEVFDVVASIRFLFHVPPELRPAILREMARVSRRYVVVDVRHKYCWTTQTKRLRAWMSRERMPFRASLADIDRDLRAAELELVARVWLAPLLSEKMLLVCRKPSVPS